MNAVSVKLREQAKALQMVNLRFKRLGVAEVEDCGDQAAERRENPAGSQHPGLSPSTSAVKLLGEGRAKTIEFL